jgi:hypothetical protein
VRNALGSCIDYAPVTSLPPGVPAAAGVDAAELAFELDENLSAAEPSCEPYAHELLAGAQARHRIFRDELVVKAFFEAERAHRGQVNCGAPASRLASCILVLLNLMGFLLWLCDQKRASGDPYLQHCVETAVHLAKIGATATVVSAGLLHDTIDDSFMDYGHIFRMFGAGVADLVEGV